MFNLTSYIQSSIGKKQIVAVTGLLLILFLLGHLAGNLIIYLGPDAFNAYAHKMANLRPGLYVVEAGLLGIFLIHMLTTFFLVLENIRSRSQSYKQLKSKKHRSIATRLMPITGTIIIAFVIWHLLDFTFVDKHGPRSYLPDGRSYELFGIVYNSFADPVHSLLYVAAIFSLALHLSHGVQSFAQTFGFNHPAYTPLVKKISNIFALLIAFLYSSIPIYVMYSYAYFLK